MRTYARIDQDVVMELFSTDLDMKELFHPDLVWADVTEETPTPDVGWSATREGEGWNFEAPPPPDVI